MANSNKAVAQIIRFPKSGKQRVKARKIKPSTRFLSR